MKRLLLPLLITLSTTILAKTPESLFGVYINNNVLDYVTNEEFKSKSRDKARSFYALKLTQNITQQEANTTANVNDAIKSLVQTQTLNEEQSKKALLILRFLSNTMTSGDLTRYITAQAAESGQTVGEYVKDMVMNLDYEAMIGDDFVDRMQEAFSKQNFSEVFIKDQGNVLLKNIPLNTSIEEIDRKLKAVNIIFL